MTKYYVMLASGKYLTQPPVVGRRNLSSSAEIGEAYNFGCSANHVARDIKGAQVVSVERTDIQQSE